MALSSPKLMVGLVFMASAVVVVAGHPLEAKGPAAAEVAPQLAFLETGLAPLPIQALEVVPEFQTAAT
jgi:hypothetical protein